MATYDMCNNMIRRILIFSIRQDRVVFVREHGPYNIAADEPIFLGVLTRLPHQK
ncbi:MAG: hypothetical protein HUU37_01810 [Bdellovibrionales bacterium]|nr:hypothetical protein [Bdellovibrionales bacterium]